MRDDRKDNPTSSFTAGSTEEAVLSELFAEVLELESVGVDDDFFDLGGHSILLMWLRNRIRERLGCEVSVRTVFEAPTVSQLGKRIRDQETNR